MIDLIKDISLSIAPLSKVLVETFLTPKLTDLSKKWKRQNDLYDTAFTNKFLEYINRSYQKYSILNTLVFHNRKHLLKDLYIPLEIIQESNRDVKFVIDSFDRNLIPSLKKVLIIDTAGMGKSTLMKRIFLSIIESNEGIPILIELRRLSKTKDIIDEIIEQLNPINENFEKEFILDLINRGDFIFLFDGYDEIPIEERQEITKNIQDFISKAGNNQFVMTSRPEGSLSSFGNFIKFRVRPLIKNEAFALIRKYDDSNIVADSLIQKIESSQIESINEFLTNPLLVSLLFTAFEYKQKIPFKKHIFYRQVFDALFESHDLTKGESFYREKFSKLDSEEFHKNLRFMGYICLTKNKIEFTKDELIELVKQAKIFTKGTEFKESDFIKDLTNTVPLFTIDGLYYKWAHKSLQEYFAAQFIYLDVKDNQKDILLKLYNHSQSSRFYNLFDLYYSIDSKSFRQILVHSFLNEFITYCNTSYSEVIISESEKNFRQNISFFYDAILVKFNGFETNSNNKQVREVFDIVISYLEENQLQLSFSLTNNTVGEDKLNYVKVFLSSKNKFSFRSLLKNKGFEIFKSENSNELMDIIDINLDDKKPYLLDENPKSILNHPNYFNQVNQIIYFHALQHHFRIFDTKKILDLLKEINLEIESEKNLDDLLAF